MRKKIVAFLAIVLLLGFFYALGKQIFDALDKGKRLDIETEDLARLQKKNFELKKKLAEVQSLQFIEERARNKLNLARPNETVIIIPQEVLDKVLKEWEEEKKTETSPNWQGWLKLFWQ